MISIVVPCYNAEKTLNRTVNSLCNQTEGNYQIILVDDGSNDSTPHVCDRLAQNDSRIKVIHQENKGLMGAWKQGVLRADGEYIAFCDSDDYVDEDLIEKVQNVIKDYSPDLILFGVTSEYSNGDTVRSYNRLKPGYYDQNSIKQDILPYLLSDGNMQSEIIMKSRCSKVFRKEILLSIMDNLNEEVSIGEDQLTMFATVQVIHNLFCMGEYCPYHYVRTSNSMIGRFDKRVFVKLKQLYNEMYKIATIYDYPYTDQILCDKLSVLLLYVKKCICRSKEGYRSTRLVISNVRNSREFITCITRCSVNNYSMGAKLFAKLFIIRLYSVLYLSVRVYDWIRRRGIDV